jgi:hypothetical protein
MVKRYLRISDVEHVLDGMCDRAHGMDTDSVISLAKYHRGQEGRSHIVVELRNRAASRGTCVKRTGRQWIDSEGLQRIDLKGINMPCSF